MVVSFNTCNLHVSMKVKLNLELKLAEDVNKCESFRYYVRFPLCVTFSKGVSDKNLENRI